jgi:transcriptional regulator with XRE-family HTH domain
MSFSDRLELFCEASGLKKKDILEKTGVSRSIFFAYLRGDSQPAPKFFLVLKEAFPWVNIEWLITGQGEMVSRKEDFSTYQVATGNGNIQAGGSINGKVVGGVYADESRQGAATVDVDQVVRVLADYLAPKAIEEIRKRLSEGA